MEMEQYNLCLKIVDRIAGRLLENPPASINEQLVAAGFGSAVPFARLEECFFENVHDKHLANNYRSEVFKQMLNAPLHRHTPSGVKSKAYISSVLENYDNSNTSHPAEMRARELRGATPEKWIDMEQSALVESRKIFREEANVLLGANALDISTDRRPDIFLDEMSRAKSQNMGHKGGYFSNFSPVFEVELGEYRVAWFDFVNPESPRSWLNIDGRDHLKFEPSWILMKGRIPRRITFGHFGEAFGSASSAIADMRSYLAYSTEGELRRCIAADLFVFNLVIEEIRDLFAHF